MSFWISRRFGRNAFRWLVGASGLSQVDALAARAGGWRALLFTRLVIPQVYNYMSYAAGLTALPFRQYLAVTALGGILPTTFTVALGAGINADRGLLALTYGALACLGLLILFARRRSARSADAASRPPNPDRL